MKTQAIRETFLDYFAGKNHKIVESSSLFPKDDPTLLFTNAGMNQFKNVFLGLEKRSYARAASVQKCMRVSGKHNDLETVGKTAKHHTFFEMLGNFSFGDYFKQDAILYAWELMTGVFKLPESRLYATVYTDDDEAFAIWNKEAGLAESKVFRLGKEDNYWSMGETGPCGPCSEIHYDMGSEFGAGKPEELIRSGHDRFVELWNLVFMQFNQDAQGQIVPLPSPSVDTGMGLERMAAVLQRRVSNFDTDVFSPITAAISDRIEREPPFEDEDSNVAVRIIADHVRATAFLIGDGIMPANEGRGYVLRRIIRRAFRAGNSLGLEEPFLFTLIGVVCDIMKDAYPELLTSADYIANVCKSEEKRFASTLSSGLKVFQQYVAEIKTHDTNMVPGDMAFKLYDTFGFPLDLTQELSNEQGLQVDEDGFHIELDQQRQRARQSWKGEELRQELQVYEPLKCLAVRFVGYEQDRLSDARVLALMQNGSQVDEIAEGDTGEVFLQETPFYAEAGGQVSDTGTVKNSHFSGLVENAWVPIPDIISHKVRILAGRLKVGDFVEAEVNVSQRLAIRKNHTATHLLHASLRRILGDHVKQAGSLVAPGKLRFDFTHFSGLSSSEKQGIEALVNRKIQEAIPVRTELMSLDQAFESGAMAIFEEKYREQVRVVIIQGFSRELCGGVHARNTGEIGLFRIISESSVAAGMRRIEAVTGESALESVQTDDELLEDLQSALNAPRSELLGQLERMKKALKESDKELKSMRQKMLNRDFKQDTEDLREVSGISVLTKEVDALPMSELRDLADVLKQRLGSGLVVLGTQSEGKAFLVAAVTKDLLDTVKADQIIRKISPFIKGGGGGRSDFAQAGGSNPSGLKRALEEAYTALANITSKGD
jgi:alanyl-tRNA synthetase